GAEVEWKPLREIVLQSSNIRWQDASRSYRYIDLTSVCREKNTIIETIAITKDNAPSRAQKLILKDDIIFATTRPTQQRLCLIIEEYSGEIASTGYCVLRANTNIVLPKWIYFWITSNKFKNYVEKNQSGSAYPAISDAKVKEFQIPIPSLEIQKEIVRILDKFDTLTTSISEGLPKEIELRQKQYEYYREMLLTFPTDN
ncbi:MAG: restriction endonuclease subunit S, partial [Akkermansia sp.]